MLDISAQLSEVQTDLAAAKNDYLTLASAVSSLTGQVTTLNTTITGLQTQLATAGLSADQQAALAATVTAADALKSQGDAIVATLPPPTVAS